MTSPAAVAAQTALVLRRANLVQGVRSRGPVRPAGIEEFDAELCETAGRLFQEIEKAGGCSQRFSRG